MSGNVEPGDGEVEGPMPVASDDQVRRPSALTPLTAYRWFLEYGGRPGTGWVNEMDARTSQDVRAVGSRVMRR